MLLWMAPDVGVCMRMGFCRALLLGSLRFILERFVFRFLAAYWPRPLRLPALLPSCVLRSASRLVNCTFYYAACASGCPDVGALLVLIPCPLLHCPRCHRPNACLGLLLVLRSRPWKLVVSSLIAGIPLCEGTLPLSCCVPSGSAVVRCLALSADIGICSLSLLSPVMTYLGLVSSRRLPRPLWSCS